jgi:uncharacterized protein YjiS (DUF1127 family)
MTIYAKQIFDEAALYRTAREMRAKAFADLIGKAAKGIAGFVNRTVLAPMKARAQRERQLEELMNMDEHMLRDLGLSRGGIAYAFEHGREGEVAGAAPANVNTPITKPRAA